MTKLTVYAPALVIVGLALILRWRIEKRSIRWLLGEAAWVAGLALFLGGAWAIRNINQYGWPDFLGQAAHEAAVVGQLRTVDYVSDTGIAAYLRTITTTTLPQLLGSVRWMGVPLPQRDYLLIGLFSLGLLTGVIIFIRGHLAELPIISVQRAGLWVLTAVALATIAGFIYYNVEFVQFQGRYLYPLLIPVSFVMALGAWSWTLTLQKFIGHPQIQRALAWLPLIAFTWMPLYALWALIRYVVPNLQ